MCRPALRSHGDQDMSARIPGQGPVSFRLSHSPSPTLSRVHVADLEAPQSYELFYVPTTFKASRGNLRLACAS